MGFLNDCLKLLPLVCWKLVKGVQLGEINMIILRHESLVIGDPEL